MNITRWATSNVFDCLLSSYFNPSLQWPLCAWCRSVEVHIVNWVSCNSLLLDSYWNHEHHVWEKGSSCNVWIFRLRFKSPQTTMASCIFCTHQSYSTLFPTQNGLFFNSDTTNLSPPLSSWRGGGPGNYSTSLTWTLPCQISSVLSVFHLHGRSEFLVLGSTFPCYLWTLGPPCICRFGCLFPLSML